MFDRFPSRGLARRRAAISSGLLVFVAVAGCSAGGVSTSGDGATPPATPSRAAEPIATDLALATFDSAWSRINSSYYDPDFRGIDWPGVRDELRPAVEGLGTRGELRDLLGEMLSRLGESHFAILPQESVDEISIDQEEVEGDASADPGDLGLEVRWVDDALTVFRTFDGAAREAGVRPGWIIEAIGDREMSDWTRVIGEADSETARVGLRTQTVMAAGALTSGPVGSTVALRLRDGDGTVQELEIERRPVRGEVVKFGQLPSMVAYLDHRRVRHDDGCVGVIEFNVWMVPLVADFNRAVDEVADCTGVVIDLRGNTGGVGGMVMSTAGSFFAERADLGIVKSRSGEMRFVAMPRGVDTEGQLRDAFTGRLAVLIDGMSMSTSEIFAAGLKSTGRATLFGSTTPGYALPAMTIRLPSQDVLYHVISDLTDPDGQRIEGSGVEPDVPVELLRTDLLAGRDAVLDAAVSWAAGGSPAP